MDIDREALADTWRMFRREHRCSVDRMLCNPALRADFLAAARSVCGCEDEESILWNVVNLRKRKSLAQQQRSTPPTEQSISVQPMDTRSDP